MTNLIVIIFYIAPMLGCLLMAYNKFKRDWSFGTSAEITVFIIIGFVPIVNLVASVFFGIEYIIKKLKR